MERITQNSSQQPLVTVLTELSWDKSRSSVCEKCTIIIYPTNSVHIQYFRHDYSDFRVLYTCMYKNKQRNRKTTWKMGKVSAHNKYHL